MKRTLASAFLCLMLATPAWADFDEGVAAYRRGDYATALREFRLLAEQGVAKAQLGVGFMYRDGQGVTQNYAEAAKWHRKAAEQGYDPAQISLGFMYRDGQGVTQNYAESASWYRKAAEQGVAKAQFNLGFIYDKGLGVTQNYVEAHMWYNLAAAQAAQGDESGIILRDLVAKLMTPAQIAEAQRRAAEWRPRKK